MTVLNAPSLPLPQHLVQANKTLPKAGLVEFFKVIQDNCLRKSTPLCTYVYGCAGACLRNTCLVSQREGQRRNFSIAVSVPFYPLPNPTALQ